jgi:hypothetical protein
VEIRQRELNAGGLLPGCSQGKETGEQAEEPNAKEVVLNPDYQRKRRPKTKKEGKVT